VNSDGAEGHPRKKVVVLDREGIEHVFPEATGFLYDASAHTVSVYEEESETIAIFSPGVTAVYYGSSKADSEPQ
jgi:hypothetical protein